MNKRQAKAILQLSAAINKACDKADKDLRGWEGLENARAYWLAHLRGIANGQVYGGLPLIRAHNAFERE